jgi:DNA repair protein Swi5/Sae3
LISYRERKNQSTITPSQEPSAIVQRHIRLLHQYNEIKDIGQGLMGLIAEARGVRYADVQKEYGVGKGD